MRDDKPINRRAFFRFGLRRLAERALDSAIPMQGLVEQLTNLHEPSRPAPAKRPGTSPARRVSLDIVLRPPGALDEQQFVDTCSRCGDCAKVCPAEAILLDPTGKKGNGAPWIDANVMSCVLCDGLYCMDACSTGALAPTPLLEIDMGTARWAESMCVRSDGEDCTLCVDQCPVGEAALRVEGRSIQVIDDACTGCGVCQTQCPTDPKAIIVIPRSARR